MRKDVIVIGAGLGGMSCAAFLAKNGLDVLVLEANDQVGGSCRTSEQDGFLFEDGALWLSMDYLCDQVFSELGADFHELVPAIRLNPSTLCLLPDGERFLFKPSKEAVADEVNRISPPDLPRFHAFLDAMEQREDFVSGDLYNSPMTFRTMLSLRFWKHARFLLTSYKSEVERMFKDEKVRLAFTRPVMFIGLPPSRCPAAFLLASSGEIMSGSTYPHGGMGNIPRVLADLLVSFGGTIRTEAKVTKCTIKDGRVTGVQLTDGESIAAQIVVSNVHVQTSYLDLVGRGYLPRFAVRRLTALKLGHSYFGVQLGLDYEVDGPANIPSIPKGSEMADFWNTIETSIPKRLHPNVAIIPADAGVAPPGMSVVSVYHAAPHDPAPIGWESYKEEFGERLITQAEHSSGISLHGHIMTRRIWSPIDLEKKFRLPEGAMYGLAPTLLQSGPFRPANRSPWIKGFYLTGQTTNPGLGVASAIASGSITAKLVLSDF